MNICFSTELDVEDFDAFLEKVKARSLGTSPFACKSCSFWLFSWILNFKKMVANDQALS